MKGFRERLRVRQLKINSLVCAGFDPLEEKLPNFVRDAHPVTWVTVLAWMAEIADAVAPYVSMFKPQRAHWEAIDGGLRALQAFVAQTRLRHPTIPIFLDCKRGDIGRTQGRYRDAHFNIDGVDGMNYNGYMGSATLEALVDLDHLERALVGLGRTSNPEAWEIQDVLLSDGRQYWEFMVERILRWSEEFGVLDNAGVVMGAAHKDPDYPDKIYSCHLARALEIHGGKLWTLIPGIGTQGGFILETILAAFRGAGTIAINSSSGITFASSRSDFAEAAAREAMKLRDQIREAGGNCETVEPLPV